MSVADAQETCYSDQALVEFEKLIIVKGLLYRR